LGIIINSSLAWTYHISLLKQKVNRTIGILKYVRFKLSTCALKLLYSALVNPYYEYGNNIWGGGNTTAVKSLMSRTKWNAHTAPLIAMLKLLNLYDIHKLQVASLMFKVNHSMLPVYFCNMFTANCNSHMHSVLSSFSLVFVGLAVFCICL